MKLSEIIAQADAYVPNTFTDAQKAGWLTEINNQFYETVKMPEVYTFPAVKGRAVYALPDYIQLRNIDRVTVGTAKYEPPFGDVPPGRNMWSADDFAGELTLTPAPFYDATGSIRYATAPRKDAYTVADLAGVSAQAPDAYHMAYVYGLAEKMALALDDLVKASNFGQQYHTNLAIAQANYRGGGSA